MLISTGQLVIVWTKANACMGPFLTRLLTVFLPQSRLKDKKQLDVTPSSLILLPLNEALISTFINRLCPLAS